MKLKGIFFNPSVTSDGLFIPTVCFSKLSQEMYYRFKLKMDSNSEAKEYAYKACTSFIDKNIFLNTEEDWNKACKFFDNYNDK